MAGRAGALRARLRRTAAAILQAGLRAADPRPLVARELRVREGVLEVAGLRHRRGRLLLLAVGKAAVPMAAAAERALGELPYQGLAVAPTASAGLAKTRLLLAGHPIPDARGLAAAAEVEDLLRGLGRDDLLLLLLSGGASALLPAPAPGISLADKAATTALLLRAGAPIADLNAVRKHLSRLKGGGVARLAAPARVACLVLSDVVGDDLATIASGPAAPDPTRFADAVAALRQHGVWGQVPASVRRRLLAGERGELAETAKPGDPAFRRVVHRIIGSTARSLGAAAREARRHGLLPLVLTSTLEGEAREVARVLVSILRERARSGPVCLLAGGETTVRVRGEGLGGRNQELAVAAAALLSGFPAPAVLAALATDGRDGPTSAAGGVADDCSLARAVALGLPVPADFLARNDAHRFLAPLGDLLLTGPTGTNVADLVVALAAPPARTRT
jgi:hydroxypyruvate reductase